MIETIKKYLDDGGIVCWVYKVISLQWHGKSRTSPLKGEWDFGIRSKQNDWCRSFLTNRKQYVSIEVFLSQTKIKCGVLQASTLGPLLFLIYINDLTNALGKSISYYFADNTNLL